MLDLTLFYFLPFLVSFSIFYLFYFEVLFLLFILDLDKEI